MHLSKSEWSTMSSILMVYAKHMYDSIRLKQFEIDKPPSTKQHVVFEKASLWLACCHVVFLSLYLAVAAKQHQQAIATYAYSSGKLAHTHEPASSQPSTRGGGGINYLAWGGGGGALLQSPSIKASSCGRTEGERKFRVSRGSWASIGLRLSSSPYRAVSSVCRHPYWIFFPFFLNPKSRYLQDTCMGAVSGVSAYQSRAGRGHNNFWRIGASEAMENELHRHSFSNCSSVRSLIFMDLDTCIFHIFFTWWFCHISWDGSMGALHFGFERVVFGCCDIRKVT